MVFKCKFCSNDLADLYDELRFCINEACKFSYIYYVNDQEERFVLPAEEYMQYFNCFNLKFDKSFGLKKILCTNSLKFSKCTFNFKDEFYVLQHLVMLSFAMGFSSEEQLVKNLKKLDLYRILL